MYENSFWPFLPPIQPLKRERKKLPGLGLLGAPTPPSSSCSSFCFVLLYVSSIFSTFSSLPFPSLQDFQSGEHTGSCKEALSAFRVESTLGQDVFSSSKMMEEWLDQPAHPSCTLPPCLVCKGEYSVLMLQIV
ncbi:unnamed protein product [Victoria cruziana]